MAAWHADACGGWLNGVPIVATVVVMQAVWSGPTMPLLPTRVEARSDRHFWRRRGHKVLRSVVARQPIEACTQPTVRVGAGMATTTERTDVDCADFAPHPDGLNLSITVERDRNNRWRVSRLDDAPLPAR